MKQVGGVHAAAVRHFVLKLGAAFVGKASLDDGEMAVGES
jgi:hypothetical protein